MLNFTVLFIFRDYTAKYVDIGLDLEKRSIVIHLISEIENLLSDKLYMFLFTLSYVILARFTIGIKEQVPFPLAKFEYNLKIHERT